MTYEVQQTRWDRLIRRVSGSIGPGSRVSETISELFPVLDVERVPGELLLLAGTHLAHGAAAATGAAGEVPNVLLSNPADSGTLITVTGLTVSSDTAGDRIRWEVVAIAGSRVNTERFRDTRLNTPSAVPVAQVRTASNPSLVRQDVDFIAPVVNPFHISDENGLVILGPNTSIRVGSITVTATIVVTFWWRERAAQDSELQF